MSFCVVDEALSTGRIGGCGDVVEEGLSIFGAICDVVCDELVDLLLGLWLVLELELGSKLNGVDCFLDNLEGVKSGDVGSVGRFWDAMEYGLGERSGDSMERVTARDADGVESGGEICFSPVLPNPP